MQSMAATPSIPRGHYSQGQQGTQFITNMPSEIRGHEVKVVGLSIKIDLCAKFSVQSDFELLHFAGVLIQLTPNTLDLFVDGFLVSGQHLLRFVKR